MSCKLLSKHFIKFKYLLSGGSPKFTSSQLKTKARISNSRIWKCNSMRVHYIFVHEVLKFYTTTFGVTIQCFHHCLMKNSIANVEFKSNRQKIRQYFDVKSLPTLPKWCSSKIKYFLFKCLIWLGMNIIQASIKHRYHRWHINQETLKWCLINVYMWCLFNVCLMDFLHN